MQIQLKINEVYLPFWTCEHRYAILYGGAGSGKSIVAAQKILFRLTTEEKHRFLVIRKHKEHIRKSVFQNFKDLISAYNLDFRFKIQEAGMIITDKFNGNMILFAGIDDPEKMKSITGITGIWSEETTELEEDDLDQLDMRLRGETPNYKQIIITFNPTDERHWLKNKFFDEPDNEGDVFTLQTTYLDNAFLDEEYIRILLNRIGRNPNNRRIYVFGEWGREILDGRFWDSFTYELHVSKVAHLYNPHLPLHLSFDFNVFPYVTGGLWQIQDNLILKLKEYCLTTPRNKTTAICADFRKDFPKHASGLYIYGDPSGKSEDTRSDNDYTIIFRELKDYNPKDRVLKAHPPVVTSSEFMSRILDNEYKYRMLVDEKCKNTIDDFLYIQQAADGTMLIKKITDKKTKRTYEEFGHCSDESRYFIISAFQDEYKKYISKDKTSPVIIHRPKNDRGF